MEGGVKAVDSTFGQRTKVPGIHELGAHKISLRAASRTKLQRKGNERSERMAF